MKEEVGAGAPERFKSKTDRSIGRLGEPEHGKKHTSVTEFLKAMNFSETSNHEA